MTLEELIDKAFLGKALATEDGAGIVQTVELDSSFEGHVWLEVYFEHGAQLELGRHTEFSLTDVEEQ